MELSEEVRLVAFLKEGKSSEELKKVLEQAAASSEKIKLEVYSIENKDKVEKYRVDRAPALAILGDKDYGIRFYGVPKEQEYLALLSGIEAVSKRNTALPEEIKKKVRAIDQELRIKIFTTPLCIYCPKAVKIAHAFAIENELIRVDAIDATEFKELAEKYGVSAVPKIVLNDTVSIMAQLSEKKYIDDLLHMVEHLHQHRGVS